MKHQLIHIVLVLMCSGALAQNNSQAPLDSILSEAKAEKDSLKRLEKLLAYSGKLQIQSTDAAISFLDSLITVYREGDFRLAESRAISLKAWYLVFQTQYEEALKMAHRALATQRAINDSVGASLTLNRIGVANLYFKRFEDAARYFQLALAEFEALNDTVYIDMALNNMGVLYSEWEQPEKALQYYRQSLRVRKQLKRYYWVAYSYFNMADSYRASGQLDSAQKYMDLAVYYFKNKAARKSVPALASVGVAEVYLARGKYSEAISWGHKALKDAEKINHEEVVIMAHEILAEAYSETGNYKQAYFIQKRYQELKERQDSINSYAEVAEVEARYQSAKQEATIAQLEAEKYEAESDKRSLQNWFLASAVGVLAVGFLLFSFYQRKLRRQQLAQAELKARISEMRIMALRAQMNPHFIFNCINTAQNFVLHAKKEQAYEYLSKFAKLLRMVLENSEKSTVPLDDELLQVKLYIELEQERFEGRFNFNIDIDDQLEQGVFEIPGMILQPIVENAILHGLINRGDDQGQLQINLLKRENTVVCEIIDNGVGRIRAAELKKRKKLHYQSAALPNILKRLETMRSKYSDNLDIQMVDLEEGDRPAGTKVVLTLPIQ